MEDNKNEIVENENVESTEMVVQEQSSSIMSFEDLKQHSNTKMDMITNIEDKKELYNIDNSTPDALLNDCVGEKIRVKKVLIKRYEKPMEKPVFDETTGEGAIIVDAESKYNASSDSLYIYNVTFAVPLNNDDDTVYYLYKVTVNKSVKVDGAYDHNEAYNK